MKRTAEVARVSGFMRKASAVFLIFGGGFLGRLGPVWYMCLKTENCCLETFMKIRVGEKVYENT